MAVLDVLDVLDKDIIINDTMINDEVAPSDLPRGSCLLFKNNIPLINGPTDERI